MKKSLYLLLFIILSVTATTLFAYAFGVSADTENVLYISDEGIGTSPSSLIPADTVVEWDPDVNEKYHLNSILYQAAERLGETGGTLVVCGPLTIGNAQAWGTGSSRDCLLPESGKTLTITSVYGGTDHRSANNAYLLIDEGAHLVMGSPSVWKDLEIKTGNTNRAICCNGQKTVFDTGITCSNKDGNTTYTYYPSIVGGHRYATTKSSSDITVKSGTWNTVCGAQYGITSTSAINAPSPNTYSITYGNYYYVMNGDVNITITGGAVKQYVTGDAFDLYNSYGRNVYLNGDVNITMTGGSSPYVYGTARNCFLTPGNKVNVKISGSASVTSSIRGFREDGNVFFSSRGEAQYGAASYTLDLSESDMSDTRLDSLLNVNAINFTEILYPDKWITSVTPESLPTDDTVFVGEAPSSEGAVVRVSYSDPLTIVDDYTVTFNGTSTKFTSECDSSAPGTVTARYFFAGRQYGSKAVNVAAVPSVSLSGIQIKYAETPNTQIRVVGMINKNTANGVVVDDYGVLAARKIYLPDSVAPGSDAFSGAETYSLSDSKIIARSEKIFTTSGIEIMPNEFKDKIVFVGYVKFTFGGRTYTRYSNELVRSPYEAAVKAASSAQETPEAREAVRSNVVIASDTYSVLTEYNDSEALRREVVDYMKAMSDVEWTPQSSFDIKHNNTDDVNNTTSVNMTFTSGKTYRGIPYTNYYITQYESFSDMVSGGIMPVGAPITTELGKEFTLLPSSSQKKDGLTNYYLFPGSDCSTAIITAWNRVFNIRPDGGELSKSSKRMIPGFGSMIKVGRYDSEIDREDDGGTKTILNTEKNSVRAIYNAYACLKMGDAVVHWDAENNGHTRMISDFTSGTVTTSSGVTATVTDGPVHVELASNGQVDGAKSYVITIEQANSLYKNAGRPFADSTWRVYKKYTFLELWKEYYIPVTIPELATGNSSVDGAHVYASGLDLANDLALGRLTGRVTSNRQIMGMKFTVKNASGTTVAEKTNYVESLLGIHANDVSLHEFTMTVNAMLEDLAPGEYTFSLTAIVNTHDSNVPLVSDYPFTK